MIRGVVQRSPLRVGPYVIENDAVRHPDGALSSIVRTGELDVESLDPERRAAVLAVFARLCHTLDAPLQLVVQVRPLRADAGASPARTATVGAAAGGAAASLDRAMTRFWAERLRASPAHRREVLVVTRAATESALARLVARIRESVTAMGIEAERVRGDALVDAVSAGLALAAAPGWTAHPQHVRMGSSYLRGFSLRRLPGHTVSAGWLAPLLRVGVECDIAIHLSPASLGEALATLGRRLRDFSAHRMLETERGLVGDVHVDIALDSAFELRGRLARNLGRPLHLSVTAAVRAPNVQELAHCSEAMRLAFQSALVACEPAHFRHLAALLSVLPLGVDQLGAVKLVESSAAAVCVPWLDAGVAEPGGYRLGTTMRTQTPVRVAPFDDARHANANIAVLAASGHGKSFTIGALMLEAAAQSVDCIVIDPEGEYRQVVTALGGSYVSLAPGTGTAVNVLDTADDAEEGIAALVDLVGVLCGGALDDVDRAVVDRAGRHAQATARAQGRVPLLRDCLPVLQRDAPRAATVVTRFCTGALGQLFDDETSFRLDRGVTGISLRDAAPEHMAAITLIVARWLWRLVRTDAHRRHIIFDEVGALCVHAPLRALLVQLARRCRKYRASLVVATQNAQDLLGSDEGSVVVTNCGIALLGGHRAAEAARMERAFGLTESQRRFLETAARGEFLLLAGDRRAAMRVELPPEHTALLRGAGPAPAEQQ